MNFTELDYSGSPCGAYSHVESAGGGENQSFGALGDVVSRVIGLSQTYALSDRVGVFPDMVAVLNYYYYLDRLQYYNEDADGRVEIDSHLFRQFELWGIPLWTTLFAPTKISEISLHFQEFDPADWTPGWRQCTHLTSLSIDDHIPQPLPAWLFEFRSLWKFSVCYGIKEDTDLPLLILPPECGTLRKVKEIRLYGKTPLSYKPTFILPVELARCSKLGIFICSNIQLPACPEIFGTFPVLMMVSLTDCVLGSIPESIGAASHLATLILERCALYTPSESPSPPSSPPFSPLSSPLPASAKN